MDAAPLQEARGGRPPLVWAQARLGQGQGLGLGLTELEAPRM